MTHPTVSHAQGRYLTNLEEPAMAAATLESSVMNKVSRSSTEMRPTTWPSSSITGSLRTDSSAMRCAVRVIIILGRFVTRGVGAGGGEVRIVCEVQKDGKMLTLRDENGLPVRSRGRRQPFCGWEVERCNRRSMLFESS